MFVFSTSTKEVLATLDILVGVSWNKVVWRVTAWSHVLKLFYANFAYSRYFLTAHLLPFWKKSKFSQKCWKKFLPYHTSLAFLDCFALQRIHKC